LQLCIISTSLMDSFGDEIKVRNREQNNEC
jgi:hypothetical protein